MCFSDVKIQVEVLIWIVFFSMSKVILCFQGFYLVLFFKFLDLWDEYSEFGFKNIFIYLVILYEKRE